MAKHPASRLLPTLAREPERPTKGLCPVATPHPQRGIRKALDFCLVGPDFLSSECLPLSISRSVHDINN